MTATRARAAASAAVNMRPAVIGVSNIGCCGNASSQPSLPLNFIAFIRYGCAWATPAVVRDQPGGARVELGADGRVELDVEAGLVPDLRWSSW